MKVQINFKILNPEYNRKYAKRYHEGKESESNSKYTWAVRYELNEVDSVSFIENEDFILTVEDDDGKEFEFKIPNVVIFRCYIKGGNQRDFAVSKSILNKTHQATNETYKTIRFYYYINSEPESEQLINPLRIDVNDIPKELLK